MLVIVKKFFSGPLCAEKKQNAHIVVINQNFDVYCADPSNARYRTDHKTVCPVPYAGGVRADECKYENNRYY
jgi:hypothetical protein